MKFLLTFFLLTFTAGAVFAQDYVLKNFTDHFSISQGTSGINIYGNTIKDNLGNYFLKGNSIIDTTNIFHLTGTNQAVHQTPVFQNGLSITTSLTGAVSLFSASGNVGNGIYSALQIDLRNTNSTSDKVQWVLGGGSPGASYNRTISIGTDINGNGSNDAFIYLGATNQTPFYINKLGNITLGSNGTSNPTSSAVITVQVLGTTKTPLQVGADLYESSGSLGNGAASSGSYVLNNAWKAANTITTIWGATNGIFSIYGNTGLTIGSNFTPKLLYQASTSGFIPQTTDTYTLGGSGLSWSNVYSAAFNGNTITPGTGTLTLAAGTTVSNINSIKFDGAGQTALTAGVASITMTGVTTGSLATVSLVSQGGTFGSTVAYKAVCTANTITITAVTNTGSTNTTDTSTINYIVVN